jgi:tetratricopeptide (TPR) repeat protein
MPTAVGPQTALTNGGTELAQGGSAGLTRDELSLMGALGRHYGYDHPLIKHAEESGQGPVKLLDELIAFERRRVSDEHGPESMEMVAALARDEFVSRYFGWREDGLGAITEAVAICRRLPGSAPATLAELLITQHYRYSFIGRRSEALSAITEAVGLMDKNAEKLVSALEAQARCAHKVCRFDVALAAWAAAVELRRRRRAAWLPTDWSSEKEVSNYDMKGSSLVAALKDQAGALVDSGRPEEALALWDEAAGISREGAARGFYPASISVASDSLVSVVVAKAKALRLLGRPIDALEELGRELAGSEGGKEGAPRGPDRGARAQLLSSRTDCLVSLGRLDEALVELDGELTELDREAATRGAGNQGGPVGTALEPRACLQGLRSDCLAALGRFDEALVAAGEVVALRRTILEQLEAPPTPGRFSRPRSDLARGLLAQSDRLSQLGRWEEVLRAAEEAAELFVEQAAWDRCPDRQPVGLQRAKAQVSAALEARGTKPTTTYGYSQRKRQT